MVLSKKLLGGEAKLFWSVMITSIANRGWPDDVSLEERFAECGLRIPCVVRTAKIASLEAGRASKVGKLPDDLLRLVQTRVASHLGL